MATKGSPKDMTSIVEKVVAEEAEFFKETLQNELNSVRPVGSDEVSEDEQFEEWQTMVDYPEVMAQFFASQNASVANAIRYAHKMEQKRNGGST